MEDPPPPPAPPTPRSGGVLRSAMPLPAQLVALYGRQVLEAMTYLAGTGVPTVHVHAGNVLLEDATAAARRRRLPRRRWELALLRAPAPALTLARPRPPAGSCEYRVEREVLTFGQLLYEMLSAAPLTDAELASWRAAETLGVRFPARPPRGRCSSASSSPPPGPPTARRSPTSSPTRSSRSRRRRSRPPRRRRRPPALPSPTPPAPSSPPPGSTTSLASSVSPTRRRRRPKTAAASTTACDRTRPSCRATRRRHRRRRPPATAAEPFVFIDRCSGAGGGVCRPPPAPTPDAAIANASAAVGAPAAAPRPSIRSAAASLGRPDAITQGRLEKLSVSAPGRSRTGSPGTLRCAARRSADVARGGGRRGARRAAPRRRHGGARRRRRHAVPREQRRARARAARAERRRSRRMERRAAPRLGCAASRGCRRAGAEPPPDEPPPPPPRAATWTPRPPPPLPRPARRRPPRAPRTPPQRRRRAPVPAAAAAAAEAAAAVATAAASSGGGGGGRAHATGGAIGVGRRRDRRGRRRRGRRVADVGGARLPGATSARRRRSSRTRRRCRHRRRRRLSAARCPSTAGGRRRRSRRRWGGCGTATGRRTTAGCARCAGDCGRPRAGCARPRDRRERHARARRRRRVPSVLAGMQAVVYAAMPSCVDFWWLKPSLLSPAELADRPDALPPRQGRAQELAGRLEGGVRPDRRALHARRRAERPHLLGRAPRERRRGARRRVRGERLRYYVHLIWRGTLHARLLALEVHQGPDRVPAERRRRRVLCAAAGSRTAWWTCRRGRSNRGAPQRAARRRAEAGVPVSSDVRDENGGARGPFAPDRRRVTSRGCEISVGPIRRRPRVGLCGHQRALRALQHLPACAPDDVDPRAGFDNWQSCAARPARRRPRASTSPRCRRAATRRARSAAPSPPDYTCKEACTGAGAVEGAGHVARRLARARAVADARRFYQFLGADVKYATDIEKIKEKTAMDRLVLQGARPEGRTAGCGFLPALGDRGAHQGDRGDGVDAQRQIPIGDGFTPYDVYDEAGGRRPPALKARATSSRVLNLCAKHGIGALLDRPRGSARTDGRDRGRETKFVERGDRVPGRRPRAGARAFNHSQRKAYWLVNSSIDWGTAMQQLNKYRVRRARRARRRRLRPAEQRLSVCLTSRPRTCHGHQADGGGVRATRADVWASRASTRWGRGRRWTSSRATGRRTTHARDAAAPDAGCLGWTRPSPRLGGGSATASADRLTACEARRSTRTTRGRRGAAAADLLRPLVRLGRRRATAAARRLLLNDERDVGRTRAR